MATVKVKLRSSSVQGKPGVIFYQITHQKKIGQITTRIHLFAEQWDTRMQKIIVEANDPVLQSVRRRIDNDLAALWRIIRNYETNGSAFTSQNVVEKFMAAQECISIRDCLKNQIRTQQDCNRFGTARNYQRMLNSLTAFLEGEDPPITALNEQFVERYNAFLVRRNILRNSISFYMRILRALYNRAVRHHLTEQTYPFQNVYTGVDRTRKRAVSESIVARLGNLDLHRTSGLALARDIFIFCYCSRGMAFVDAAHLKTTDITNGLIRYVRHKTGRQMEVRIEPCMQQILDRYADKIVGSHIFPFIRSDNPEEAYRQYQSALNYYNRQLKCLAAMIGIKTLLTSYTPRHSWATAARNHNVPISIISAGMGHTSEQTTQIYLTSLENSVIDTANRKIIGALNAAVSM